MKHWLTALAFLVVCSTTFAGHPTVPGFERFHSKDPDAAGGRLLLTELNCTTCHHQSTLDSKGAPDLSGVGARLQPDWLLRFLADPESAHGGTTMPNALHRLNAKERKIQSEALVHFLVSQKKGWKPPGIFKFSAPATGGRLFSRIGCAACHIDPLSPQGDTEPAGFTQLAHVKDKYSYPALSDFIADPLKHRSGGRMPDLQISAQQAADIAAYLLDTLDQAENSNRSPLKPFAIEPGKVELGRQIFGDVGCANCHASELHPPTLTAPDLSSLRDSDCSQVSFDLSIPQKRAVSAALKPQTPSQPKDRISHTLTALNCYACHQREGRGGPQDDTLEVFSGNEALGNEGRFPPHLSGVGRKLTLSALEKALEGEGSIRPYLHTRMPVFGSKNTAHLPADFASADHDPKDLPLKPNDLEAGRVLMGTQGGVGCITCHGLKGRKGLAMHSVQLDGATKRYQSSWFREHLIDPQKTGPGTLMPSFWPNGTAGNKTILGGDTEKQVAAIWHYLGFGTKQPPGFPDFDSGEFEIAPTDKPIIQRAFMEDAGTHAIAVGFPQNVHFAFDADECAPVIVWKGRFIDGYRPWFSRMDPSASPLGTDIKKLPLDKSIKTRRFKGYRLDQEGIPTFLYTQGTVEITERLSPNKIGGLDRTITRDGKTTKEQIQW